MKIFIVSPPIHDAPALADAFRSLGHEPRVLTFADFRPGSVVGKVAGRLSRSYRGWVIRRSFNRLLQDVVVPALEAERPHLTLFLKSERPSSRNTTALNLSGTPIFLWAIDSLARAPQQLCLEPIARHSFVIDGGDMAEGRRTWLPLGYDDALFRPRQEKTIDLLFVGFLKQPHYATRRRLLLETAQQPWTRRLRCAFMGSTGYRQEDAWLRKALGWDFVGYADVAKYAEVIGRSRVCVNIHQDDGLRPVNPSFFSIPGSRVCEVTDRREYLADWLVPGQQYLPFDSLCLPKGLQTLFNRPGEIEETSESGWRATRRDHTYRSRAQAIVETYLEKAGALALR